MVAATAAPNNPTLPAPLNQPHPKTQADWQQVLNQLASWQQGLGTLIPPYQQTAAEQAAGVTPTNYSYLPGDVRRYGCDITGKTDCTTAVNTALKVYAQVILPPGSYLIDGSANGGVITIPANTTLWALPGTVTFNITANAGSIAVTSSAFQLTHHSMVSGLVVIYPGQTLSDTVPAIIQYPPTFAVNPANNANFGGYCHIQDITSTGAYIFGSVQGAFFECFWTRCVSYSTLFRGVDLSGTNVAMGDTSRINDCQFVMTGTQGFNAGPVNTWTATNAIGINGACQGSNRIDGLIISNTNVTGGSIGISAGVNCWFQCDNCGADSVTQAVLVTGSGSQFYADELWCSLQQQNLGFLQVPAIRCTGGVMRITNAEVSMQTAGAENAVFIDSGTVELVNVRFVTSRGGFAPVVFNSAGTVQCSGCIVSAITGLTPNGQRPLAWRDVIVGFVGTGIADFSIDGKTCVQPSAGVLSLTNFNMSTWVGGVPSNWTTTAGSPSAYFQNLNPIDGNTGVQFSGAGTGPSAVSLAYALPASADDLFGYYLLIGKLQVNNPGNASTIFYVSMTDGSGTKVYQVDLAWGGGNAETIAIPSGAYYNFAIMLCAPAGTALGNVVFNFNFQTSTNLTIRVANLAMFGMRTAPECSGQEYWSAQTGGVPRDIQLGPNRRLLRAAAPTSGVWSLGDVSVNSAAPASGVTEYRWTGTWSPLNIP